MTKRENEAGGEQLDAKKPRRELTFAAQEPCDDHLSKEVVLTVTSMQRAHEKVEQLLASYFPRPSQRHKAEKMLEAVWMEVMQDDRVVDLATPPFAVLLSSAAARNMEKRWGSSGLSPGCLNEIFDIYREESESVAEEPDYRAVVRERDGLRAENALHWPELQCERDATQRGATRAGYKGKVLVWTVGSRTVLVRPLVTPSLASIAAKAPLQLALHTAAYCAMHVDGNAMGLSQRFADRVLAEPWARGRSILEMYTHLTNKRFPNHATLSMLPVVDGAVGRMQDFNPTALPPDVVLMCNPPYLEAVLDRDLPRVVESLEQGKAVSICCLLPDWCDNKGVACVVQSQHVRSHWLLPAWKHKAVRQTGQEVDMRCNQRLVLLSTDRAASLSDELWSIVAKDPSDPVPHAPSSSTVQ
eukprot:Sspe_Gene.78548::Locus_49132_Transcript_1_1_Confidence_1.000_Length_1311::g.78548::m.78548